MPMVEFVWWPATAEFLVNVDAVIDPTVSHISSAYGCLGIYYGLQEEDRAVFWMVVVWQSHDHHQAMMNGVSYPQMVGRLKPFFNGELKMNHVEFDKETTSTFEAAVTCILFIQIKQTEADESDKLSNLLQNLSRETSGTWGSTQEESAMKILVLGLENSYRESSDSYTHLLQASELQSLLDIERIHVKFKRVFGTKEGSKS